MSKDVMEIGQVLLQMVNSGREAEAAFVDEYYDAAIVSLEGGDGNGDSDTPSRMEDIDAIRGKHQWWYDNNEVHSTTATGPYVGHRDDQFVTRFLLDLTPAGGERMQMDEVGLFTVANGKMVQEEYLYLIPAV